MYFRKEECVISDGFDLFMIFYVCGKKSVLAVCFFTVCELQDLEVYMYTVWSVFLERSVGSAGPGFWFLVSLWSFVLWVSQILRFEVSFKVTLTVVMCIHVKVNVVCHIIVILFVTWSVFSNLPSNNNHPRQICEQDVLEFSVFLLVPWIRFYFW